MTMEAYRPLQQHEFSEALIPHEWLGLDPPMKESLPQWMLDLMAADEEGFCALERETS